MDISRSVSYPPDKERYEASKHIPTKHNGMVYPCTDKQLNDLWHLHLLNDDHFRGLEYHPISYRRAAKELEVLLKNQNPRNLQAFENLQQVLPSSGYWWGPDLPIKAFNDLDQVLFGGYLRGRVGLRWEGDTKALASSVGHDPSDVMGITMPIMKGRPPIMVAEVILNSQQIFLKTTPEMKWKRMWNVLIHEMIHGMLSLQATVRFLG